ncbi:serine hydrolase domain-containing protein [Streptomyces jumonjinensis]|uniref:serine hydrolase domain-containing protein n=1 Tax=Streptomyces jumonjinensis TaxID=1945 RepID=UPI00378FC121
MTARGMARTGAAGIAAAVAVAAFAAPAQADTSTTERQRHQAVQRALDTVVTGGVPGVTAQTRDGRAVWNGASGVGDLRTGKARGKNDLFRVASITKTFVATVMLQMEAEGKLSLDDTVERHLPGAVTGNGNDGGEITVRQLLNHSSGIYDYLQDPEYMKKYMLGDGFLKHRYDYRSPQVAVDVARTHRPYFAPGTGFRYSNTNYVLAALIMEKLTGNSYEHEVRERIVKPLKLRHTTAPGDSSAMPKPSSRAYSKLTEDPAATKIYDVTRQNASQSWAEGDIISSSNDLNRFYRALLRGKLLPEKQLTAMKTLSPHSVEGGSGYGLALEKMKLSCDVEVWGHTGGWIGSLSVAYSTEDGGRQLAFNTNGDWEGKDLLGVMEAGFCGAKAKAAPKTAPKTTPGAAPKTTLKTMPKAETKTETKTAAKTAS